MTEQTIDPKGQSTKTTDPAGETGQSTKTESQTQQTHTDNLPEKFKGKTAEDIAKSYLELEKTLGTHTNEVSEVRGKLEQWEKLGQVLEANPELYKQVESEIDKLSGKKTDTTVNDQVSQDVKDTKLATENQIINGFEQRYNIHHLVPEKRQDLQKKIGQELAEMLDPGGKKTVKQVIDSIPLTRLPNYLEKAYRLATINDKEEQIRANTLIEARQNSEASFGSMSSASLRQSKGELTDQEKGIAKKMGISEEKYLAQKLKIAEE
jgi:hypothetical protein